MRHQRIAPTKGTEGDRQSSTPRLERSESTFTKLQAVLGNRAGSDRFKADLDRHLQAEGQNPHPMTALLGSVGEPKSPRNSPFRGLSHELQAKNSPSPLLVQAKMSVRPAGDRYEQEADRVAKQVVAQMRSSTASENLSKRQGAIADTNILQKQPTVVSLHSNTGSTASPNLEAAIHQQRGSGSPLPESVREPMEQALGADFSNVRIHTDGRSDELNRSIAAKAFTTGQDIFFQHGAYNANSYEGQALLAHELTHVVQQSHGQRWIQRVGGQTVGFKLNEALTDFDKFLVQTIFDLARQIQRKKKQEEEDHLFSRREFDDKEKAYKVDRDSLWSYGGAIAKIGLTPQTLSDDLPEIKNGLKALNPPSDSPTKTPEEWQSLVSSIELKDNRVYYTPSDTKAPRAAVSLQIGDAAFEALPKQPDGVRRTVYYKLGKTGDNNQYVKDDRGVFTRRYAYVEKADYQVRSLISEGKWTGQYQEKQGWLGQAENKFEFFNPKEKPILNTAQFGNRNKLTVEEMALVHQEKGSGIHQRGVSLRSTPKEVYGNAGESFRREGGVLVKVDLAKVPQGYANLINHYSAGGVKDVAPKLPQVTERDESNNKHYIGSVTKNREVYVDTLTPSMFEEIKYHSGKDSNTDITLKAPQQPQDELAQMIGYEDFLSGYAEGEKAPIDELPKGDAEGKKNPDSKLPKGDAEGEKNPDSNLPEGKTPQWKSGFKAGQNFKKGYTGVGLPKDSKESIGFLGFLQQKPGEKDEERPHGWDYARGYASKLTGHTSLPFKPLNFGKKVASEQEQLIKQQQSDWVKAKKEESIKAAAVALEKAKQDVVLANKRVEQEKSTLYALENSLKKKMTEVIDLETKASALLEESKNAETKSSEILKQIWALDDEPVVKSNRKAKSKNKGKTSQVSKEDLDEQVNALNEKASDLSKDSRKAQKQANEIKTEIEALQKKLIIAKQALSKAEQELIVAQQKVKQLNT